MCFLRCFMRCFLRCFCAYGLADSGERRKPRRTGHFGVRGVKTRSVSWPSTRMMKFKKKKRRDMKLTIVAPGLGNDSLIMINCAANSVI